jgi:DNA ligase-associated metallophosphoesterase
MKHSVSFLQNALSPTSPTQVLELERFATHVVLSVDKAMFWPEQATLFVADLHIGKSATFRSLGVPVPGGTTQNTLQRLSALIDLFSAQRVVILGDFLHASQAHQPNVIEAVSNWRDAYSSVELILVRGNHDHKAGDPAASLGINVVDEPYRIGPFAACHIPCLVEGALVLAGHVHPCIRLSGRGKDKVRLPCFWKNGETLVLPAFGAFTGGYVIEPEEGDSVWPVVQS